MPKAMLPGHIERKVGRWIAIISAVIAAPTGPAEALENLPEPVLRVVVEASISL